MEIVFGDAIPRVSPQGKQTMGTTRKHSRTRKLLEKLAYAVAPPVVWAITQFLFWSLRKEFFGQDEVRRKQAEGQTFVWALWHSRSLLLPRYYHWLGYRPIAALVSPGFGGVIAGSMLAAYGFGACYGSSRKKGKRGQEEMIEAGQAGSGLAVTVDGPSGPAEVVKPGVVRMASATGKPLYPVTYHVERCTRLPSWDRFLFPHPFSRAVFIIGNPISVPTGADADVIEAKRLEVETELHRITAQAESFWAPQP